MSDGGTPGRSTPPDELATMLERLDDVMSEARALRHEVWTQLTTQRRAQQPATGGTELDVPPAGESDD